MSIINFPKWLLPDRSVQQSPPEPFKPSATVIAGYAKDIEKYGQPLDSGLPSYFRKCADFYESEEQ